MSRDYTVMRDVLGTIARRSGTTSFNDFAGIQPRDSLVSELRRIDREGLFNGFLEFDSSGACLACDTKSLTPNGEDFYRLIENDRVWGIVFKALSDADVAPVRVRAARDIRIDATGTSGYLTAA